MKFVMKWLARVIGSALSVILVIVLLPYAARFINTILPELTGAATTLSVTLSRHMEETARLETSFVEDEGVMVSTTDALFLGEVQKVTVHYQYTASIGIDLTKVEMSVSGNTITMTLPKLEILHDSLMPGEIIREDFWYPLTDARLQKLLAEEHERCREHYLSENAETQQAWDNTIKALENTFSQWITLAYSGVKIEFVPGWQQ